MDQDTIDRLIEIANPLLGIPVEPQWRDAIRTHLQISLGHARAVAGFALPDEAEPAPVYRA